MSFKPIRLLIPILIIGLFSCTSEDRGEIETVVEKGSPGTVVHTEWNPERQQTQSSPGTPKEPKLPPQEKPANKARQSQKKTSSNTYHLQIGAFLNKKNADGLIKKLQNKGFRPFLVNSEFNRKKWNIVKVGPYQQKSKAIKTANNLAQQLKTDVIVQKNGALLERIKATVQKVDPIKKRTTATQKKKQTDSATSAQKNLKHRYKTFKSKADPKADSSKSPYSFQIGGLYSSTNAKKQLKRFQMRGYSPYMVEVIDSITKEKWYSVRIGKFKTLKDAVDEATIFASKEQIPTQSLPITY